MGILLLLADVLSSDGSPRRGGRNECVCTPENGHGYAAAEAALWALQAVRGAGRGDAIPENLSALRGAAAAGSRRVFPKGPRASGTLHRPSAEGGSRGFVVLRKGQHRAERCGA